MDDRTKEFIRIFSGLTRAYGQTQSRSKNESGKLEGKSWIVPEQLTEDNVAILRDIVKRKQNNMIKLKDGKLRIDLFTASAITQALDKRLNKDNQKKVMDIINNGSKGQFMKIVGIVMK